MPRQTLPKKPTTKGSRYKESTTYDPKTMIKTKGGHGFGMKRGHEDNNEWDASGLHLIEVFKWSVPESKQDEYKEFKKYYA